MSAKKIIDGNQTQIVDAFLRKGLSVWVLSSLGKGGPDIAVGAYGMNFFFEIKDSSKPFYMQKLTEAELRFKQNWQGQHGIIRCVEDVEIFVEKVLKKIIKKNMEINDSK